MYARLGEITDKDVYGRRRGHCKVTAVLSCNKVLVLHYPLPELRQLRPRLRLLPLSALPRRRRVRRWRLLQPGGAALRRPAGALPLLQLPAGAPRPRRLRPRPRPAPVGGRRRRQGEGQELRGQDRERHRPGGGAKAECLIHCSTRRLVAASTKKNRQQYNCVLYHSIILFSQVVI